MTEDSGWSRRGVLGMGIAATAGAMAPAMRGRAAAPASAPAPLAPRPPMGWNSWNSFATTITEAQARETAAIMAAKLLPFGYDIFTVDIQWYEPGASSYAYSADPVPTIDDHGRLLPAPNRFPSSVGGKGFAPLAAAVHAMGMKFGIHLMRGIPRLAVKRNLPILGTRHRAADIADTASICPWNPDMYGVDMTKPGAQDYYDSVFRLYAGWGVDFVKMDDMSRPYDAHAPEIEGAHKAIVNTGRPMMLSLSPGETPVIRGDHVRRHAQMWRISDDFWDDWPQVVEQFQRAARWAPFQQRGAWADADMLPFGRIGVRGHVGEDRLSRLTVEEQRTVMTLWSMMRSPLMMGGHPPDTPPATLDLLRNPGVLALRDGEESREIVRDGDLVIWSARVGARAYRAVFWLGDDTQDLVVHLADLGVGAAGTGSCTDVWSGDPVEIAEGRVILTVPGHGTRLLVFG